MSRIQIRYSSRVTSLRIRDGAESPEGQSAEDRDLTTWLHLGWHDDAIPSLLLFSSSPPSSRLRHSTPHPLFSMVQSIMSPEADVEAESPTMLLSRLQSALRQFQSSGKPFQLLGDSAAPRRCKTLIILDSSFNPPTIAHMQMAVSALRDLRTQRDIAATLRGGEAAEQVGGHGDDGVRLLLLLAVNNADKAPKPASFEHRLLMMRYFAGDIQRAWRTARAQAQEQGHEDDVPVDIGLTTHPYFHDKSTAIASSPQYEFPSTFPAASTATEQIFLAGYDTLIRIFNPKYYSAPAPEEGDGPNDKTPMQASLDPFFARARLCITMRTDADWGGREDQLRYVEGLVDGDELDSAGGRREWAKRVDMVEAMEGEDGLVLSSTEARAAVEAKDWERLRRLLPEDVAGCIERGDVSWKEGV